MQWKYALSEPTLDVEEQQAVVECLKSGWLSLGDRTVEFEAAFAKLTGSKHAIAVSSGTAALHLAMLALEVGRNAADEVVQPSINFVASANMTMAVGAKPVFADIISSLNPTIDPADMEACIGPNTKAVVVMHYGGYPARMQEITRICRARGVPIIEDACHATGYRSPNLDGVGLGTIGDIGCFSFFSNKNMTTGEGGMVVTDNDELAKRVRSLRSHGMTTLSWDRHKGRASTYDVIMHGFNYRIDELRSALGLVQLARLPAANARRARLATVYADTIADLAQDRVQYVFGNNPGAGSAHLAAVVVAPEHRDLIREAMTAQGIQTSLHYPPVHKFAAFAKVGARALPRTCAFAESMITLPMYPGLGVADVKMIASTLAELSTSVRRSLCSQMEARP